MEASPFDRLEDLFHAALALPPPEREAYLDQACAGEDDLRAELEALLSAAADAESEDFLSPPPMLDRLENMFEPVGSRLGPYVVTRRLGYGGMGDVFLGVRTEPFRQYAALKIIRPGMDSREVLQRFEMERQILAAMDHPNIARLLDGGMTSDGRPFFAMEYVDGEPITTYCDRKRLSVDDRLRLFREVCGAVHYAHQNLVLHRDLKPTNILVTAEGKVRLLDFGIAKLLNPLLSPITMPLTRTELRPMTPEYASPEQVRGEPLTTASDVYSLGVILYELLAGRRPHETGAQSTHELARAVVEVDPERPSSRVAQKALTRDGNPVPPEDIAQARGSTIDRLRRRLRGDVDNIVLMALRKEPARRYASAEQLSADITRYLSGLPVQARPSTVFYRIRKFAHRNRVGVAAAVLALVSLVSGLGVSLWQADEAHRARVRAETARNEAERALEQSEAVTQYLADLFASVDPYQTLGTELSAVELLEKGVSDIDRLSDEPLIQARMYLVFGEVYRAMGQYDRSQEFVEQSLRIRRSNLDEPHADIARSVYTLADVFRRRGRLDEAEDHYRESLAMWESLYGASHPEIAYNLNGLGLALIARGDLDAAEPLLRRALAIRRDVFAPRSTEVATSLSTLGMLLRRQSRLDEAEAVYTEALEIHRSLYGPGHPYLAELINNLAIVRRERGDHAGAEPLIREAVEAFQAIHGDDHPTTALVRQNLADILRRQGKFSEAEPVFRDALDIQRRTLGARHPDRARTLTHYAALLHATGRHTESERLYREALSILGEHFDSDHPLYRAAEDGLDSLVQNAAQR